MIWIRIGLLLVLALASRSTEASGQVPCADAQTVAEMQRCFARWYEDERARLEVVLDDYIEVLDRVASRSLRESQTAWERYLDDECTAAGERYRGGSLEGVEIFACMARGTAQRALQITLLAAAARGGDYIYDPACFVPTSDVIRIDGWLAQRVYAGPPGYRSLEEGDRPVGMLVLTLDSPLCTDLGGGPIQVSAIPLVAYNPGVRRLLSRGLGVRVELEGRLYLSQYGESSLPLTLYVTSVVTSY